MTVDIVNKAPGKTLSTRRVKETAQRILALLDLERAELSVALVGNRQIRELNSRYRRKPEPTDVLSFALGKSFSGQAHMLGDVVISVEKAEEQAEQVGRTLKEEMDKLLIHGILHLLGYDHERSRRDERIMQALEGKLLRALGDRKD